MRVNVIRSFFSFCDVCAGSNLLDLVMARLHNRKKITALSENLPVFCDYPASVWNQW